MKKQIILMVFSLFVLLFSVGNVLAQNGYRMSVDERTIQGDKGNVFVLEIDRAIEKDVLAAWEKSVERNKVKATVQKNFLKVENVVLPILGPDSVTLYSEVVQQDSSVKLYTIVYVQSLRIDPNGTEGMCIKVRNMISDFGKEVYGEVLTRELSEKTDVLNDFLKERESNLKNQDKIEKGIQEDSLKIASLETEIDQQNSQLSVVNNKYIKQKNLISTTKYESKELEKQAKEVLKEIDKERKGIEKDIQKKTNEIIDIKSQIRDDQYKLKQLQSDLETKDASITNQREMVKSAEMELQKN